MAILFDTNTQNGRYMKPILNALFSGLLLVSTARAELIRGIEFPQGSLSFADRVVKNTPGSPAPTNVLYTDPEDTLGLPDYPGGDNQPGALSLGRGGSIVLEFTNNLLTGSNSATKDLHVFEVGSAVEDTFVDISKDGVTWVSLGKVFGSTSSIDIDAFGFTSADKFRFVRLTDDPNEGSHAGDTPGADIDAVGAVSSLQVVDIPPIGIETAILIKFQAALGSTYAIEQSTDMVTWSDAVTDILGDGNEMKFFFEITTPRKFYRLKPPAP